MAAQDVKEQTSRPPTIDDLVAVCKRLNEKDVKYVLIGGFAINYYGFPPKCRFCHCECNEAIPL